MVHETTSKRLASLGGENEDGMKGGNLAGWLRIGSQHLILPTIDVLSSTR